MIASLVIALTFTAAPKESALYTFRLLGTDVGYVELSREGELFRYRSVHLYTRGDERSQQVRSESVRVGADGKDAEGYVPASFALWTGLPTEGCVQVKDELTHRTGNLCVSKVEGGVREGAVLGQKFRALMQRGRMAHLRIGDAEFVREETGSVHAFPADLSENGFEIAGKTGSVIVEPARTVTYPVLATITSEVAKTFFRESIAATSEDALCVVRAREFRKRSGEGKAAVVFGLHVEGARAFPHAWVRVQTEQGPLELDPTLQETVTSAKYVPLYVSTSEQDDPRSGTAYLGFIKGTLKLVRR